MDLGLKGKVVLVTGGTRGIGYSVASVFAEEGSQVVICGRSGEALTKATRRLQATGAQIVGIEADVCEPKSVANMVEKCLERCGQIDILVNNVGGASGSRSILDTSDEDWYNTLEVNLIQTIRVIRSVVPHMKMIGGGAIVNIASISGWVPQLSGSAQYGSAKAALIFLTERLGLELVGYNIRVNTVSPGSIQSTRVWDEFRKENPASYDTYVEEGFPMGRLGKPEEVADAVVFLASPRASWINGRNLAVDGLEQPITVKEQRPW